MFRVAIGLLVVAIIAAIFGFGGIASTATGFAKIVFVVALILAVLSFLMGGRGGGIVPLLVLGTGLALAGTAHADTVYVEGSSNAAPRHGLVLGGGLGIGHIACDGEDCDGVNEAAGLNLDIGGMLAPDLALVFDFWGMSHRDSDYATFSQAIMTAAVRFWPARILWLQGGVGVAQASWEYEDGIIDYESRSDTVPALMGAVGVEVISTSTFALDVALRAGSGFFENDTRVRNVSIGVGVNWY